VSCPVTGLPQGVNNFSVAVADNAGNSASANGSFTVDTVGPQVSSLTASAPPDSGTANIAATFGDAVSGVDTGSVQLRVDGGLVSGCTVTTASLSCAVTGQAVGSHSVELTLKDNMGNPASASTSFNVTDTRAPSISGMAPSGLIASADAVISASFSDPAPGSGVDAASVAVSLNGSPVGGCAASAAGVSCSVSGLPDGPHDVHVEVSDNAGNRAASDWSFTVSASGPVIGNLVPGNGSTYQNPKVAVSARVTDVDGVDTGSIRFYFEGVDVTTQIVGNGDVYTYNATGLADGAYTVRVTASDSAGHPAEQTWTFTVASPELRLATGQVYWESYAAYLDRLLTVDYLMSSSGSGSCMNGRVTTATATNGVTPLGPLPVNLGNMAPGTNQTYNVFYIVPHGVSNFRATSYAACDGDAGLVFMFPYPPPL